MGHRISALLGIRRIDCGAPTNRGQARGVPLLCSFIGYAIEEMLLAEREIGALGIFEQNRNQ
jgi:hypothetical protein